MKIYLKTISISLLIAVFTAIYPFQMFAQADEVNNFKAQSEMCDVNKENVLKSLNILDDIDINSDSNFVTRGKFVRSIANLIGLADAALDIELPFDDVEKNDKNYVSIASLYKLGVLSKAENFYPENNVSVNEAIKIIVSALGYDVKANSYGGYPAGYIMVASKLNLADLFKNSVNVTYSQLVNLLYESLNIKVFNVTFDGKKYFEGETVLETYHRMLTIDGQIMATYRSGFTNAQDNTRNGYIVINNNEYKICSDSNINEFLGYKVRAYVSSDLSDKNIYAYEILDNKTIEINTQDVEDEINNFKITINKTVYNLEKDYQILFNGVATDLYDSDDLTAKDGKLTLVDIDNNGKYDILSILKVEYMIWNTFSEDGSFVTDYNFNKYGKDNSSFVCLNDSNKVYDFYVDTVQGEKECKLNDLRDYPVLAFWISKDNSYVRVMGINKKISGIINAISSDYITVDDKDYEISNYAKDFIFKPAEEKKSFYLTETNKVISLVSDVDQMEYGYLMEVEDKPLGRYEFNILTSGGEKIIFNVDSSIILDNKKTKTDNAVADGVLAPYQLIKYFLSKDNIIKKIDTASYDNLFKKNLDPNDNLRLYYKDIFKWYGDSQLLMPNLSPVTSILFCVPLALKDDSLKDDYVFDDSDFYVDTLSSKYGRLTEVDVDAYVYDVTDDGNCGALVNFTNDNPDITLQTLENDSPVGVIAKVVNSTDDDGSIVKKVTMVKENKYVNYYFSNLLEETYNKNMLTIEPGDVVRYEYKGNVLTNLRVEFSYKNWEINSDIIEDYRNSSYMSIVHYYVGNIYNITDKNVFIRDESDDNIKVLSNDNKILFKYVKKDKTIKPISINDICKESDMNKDSSYKVVAITRYVSSTKLIILYEP